MVFLSKNQKGKGALHPPALIAPLLPHSRENPHLRPRLPGVDRRRMLGCGPSFTLFCISVTQDWVLVLSSTKCTLEAGKHRE